MPVRTPSHKHSWILGLFLILGTLFPLFTGAQEKTTISHPESKAAAEKNAQPTETDEAFLLTEHFRERFLEIQDEAKTLKGRLDEGQNDLDNEAQRVPSFLEIEEITAEEYQPYLEKWERMRSSYASVLEDENDRIDEVSQAKVRIESKLRLWSLREDEIRLKLAGLPKGTDDPALKAQREAMKKVIASYDDQKELAEEVLKQLGQNKTLLVKSLEICNVNYGKLSKRWEEIRFTRLKFRQQPKFSQESLILALHELSYRIRGLPTYRQALLDYVHTVWEAVTRKFLRTFLYAVSLFALALAFRQGRKMMRKIKPTAEKATTLLGKFLLGFFRILAKGAWVLFVLAAFGLLFVAFPETREGTGLFLFFAFSGAYAAWFLIQITRLLFRGLASSPKLLSIQEDAGRGIHFHAVALIICLYFFILLGFAATFLDYESEGSRLVKWLLEVAIFGLIFSFCRRRWLSELAPTTRLKALNILRSMLRVFTFMILVLIIGLDGMGYTYLSDYLAEASLKTLGLIPFLLFLGKGFAELIDYRLFSKGLARFNVSKDLLIKWKKTLRQWTLVGLWAALLFGILTIWDLKPEFLHIMEKFLSMGFTIGAVKLTVGLVLSVFLALYLSILVSRLIRALLERNLYPHKNWDLGIRNALSTGVHYVLVLIGFMVALHLLGFDLKNVTVLAGAFGVGLGFGLQNLANNFASGIVLLLERPVKVGDTIKVGDLTGKVKKIGARSTALETVDQATILIPNGELVSGQVTNWTYNNPMAGVSLPVGVAYGSDTEKVKAILLKIGQDHPDVEKDPPPEVEFKGFGDSSLNFVLRVWINDVEDRRGIQTDLYFAIEKALRENQISIPFPHREIIMKKTE